MKRLPIVIIALFVCNSFLIAQELVNIHPLTIQNAPTGVAFDNMDEMYFIAQGSGLFKVDNNSNILLSNAQVNSDLTTFNLDSDKIWVGGYGGGAQYKDDNWENYYPNTDLQGCCIYALDAKDGKIWLAMENEGASYYDGVSWNHYNSSDGISGNWHTCIAQTFSGEAFLGSVDWNTSEAFVNFFDGIAWTSIKVPGLTEITSIFVDNSGDVWAGGDGLLKFNGTDWTDYTTSIFDRNVMALEQAPNGTLYFAMSGGGVGFMDGEMATLIDLGQENFGYAGRPDGIAFDTAGTPHFCMGPTNLISDAEYGIYKFIASGFAISLSETIIAGCPGDVVEIDITIGSGFGTGIVLTAPYPTSNDNPAAGETVTMTVTIPNNSPGIYTETVSVTDGTNTTNQDFQIEIVDLPQAVSLMVPANNETMVSSPVAFDWSNSDLANDYTIIVATDVDLNDVVLEENISLSNFTDLTEILDEETTYYWAVRSNGLCGDVTSEVYTFTTGQVNTSTTSSEYAEVDVYPNPFTSTINISTNVGQEAMKIRILSADGRVIQLLDRIITENAYTISTGQLAPGLYMLQINGEGFQCTKKLIKN